MLVRLHVGILVAPQQPLSHPFKAGGIDLEVYQLLEYVLHQQRQLVTEAIHFDLNARQTFRAHLHSNANIALLSSNQI